MPSETQQASNPPAAPDGPLSSDQITPTLIMAAVAMLGGAINFWQKWKAGKVRVFNVMELVGELFVSGVCGVFAWWVCKGLGMNEWLTAAVVGVIGHMGSRAIFMAEQWMERRLTGSVARHTQSDTQIKEQ